jgi:ACS family sodium-dependent inorganic phosphate cotransporter
VTVRVRTITILHEETFIYAHILQDIPPVPWREMAKSVPLWGLIFAQIGHDWGFFTLVTDLPKYFKDVMRFNIFEVSIWI